MNILTRLILIMVLAGMGSGLKSHPGHGVPGKKGMASGITRTWLQEQLDSDTSNGLVMDMYAGFGYGWSDQLGAAEPLGTGGIPSWYVNSNLYLESPIDFGSSASLSKRKLRVDHRDFGYIPIWQPNQAVVRLQNQFTENLWGIAGMTYDGTFNQFADQLQTSQFSLNEANLLWRTPGRFLTRAGLMEKVGMYVPVFDIAPLANYSITGLALSRQIVLGPDLSFNPEIAIGQSFAGFTVLHDATGGDLVLHEGYFQTARAKTHVYGSLHLDLNGKAGALLTSGYQYIPQDTSDIVDRFDNSFTRQILAEEQGWYAGLGVNYKTEPLQFGIAYNFGYGGIDMGWGSPYYVEYSRNSSFDPTFLSRKRGSMANLVTWATARFAPGEIAGGLWFMRSTPDANKRTLPDPNSAVDTNNVLLDAGIRSGNSITVAAEEFTALRWTLTPSVELGKILRLGVRYDEIVFLDPTAHSNTLEYRRDELLNPVYHPGYDLPLYGPSKWELEAVDARIFSPFVSLDLASVFRVDLWYSVGSYDKLVERQGEVNDFHQNFSIRTTFYYRFNKHKPKAPVHDGLE